MDQVKVRALRPYEQRKLHRLKRLKANAVNSRHARIILLSRGGLRNRDIAARLHITEHTAKFHVANILTKLGVQTRGQAAAIAREARL